MILEGYPGTLIVILIVPLHLVLARVRRARYDVAEILEAVKLADDCALGGDEPKTAVARSKQKLVVARRRALEIDGPRDAVVAGVAVNVRARETIRRGVPAGAPRGQVSYPGPVTAELILGRDARGYGQRREKREDAERRARQARATIRRVARRGRRRRRGFERAGLRHGSVRRRETWSREGKIDGGFTPRPRIRAGGVERVDRSGAHARRGSARRIGRRSLAPGIQGRPPGVRTASAGSIVARARV